MNLVRGIEKHGVGRAIVRSIAQVCDGSGISTITEGAETPEECGWFEDLSIRLFRYLVAKPRFESLLPASYLCCRKFGLQ